MPYDHKKSLRTITDEQFSDGTTIDGTRIDDALREAVEHFNSVPGGDVSTRFTKTQYIFGYQPAGYTGTPVGTLPSLPVMETAGGTVEGPTWPWNFITNNEFTTAEVGTAAPIYGNPSTPTAGFQNKWRVKGTAFNQIGGPGVQSLENADRWDDPEWEDAWDVGGVAGAVEPRSAAHNYQFAWSHSWVFESPVILDSLCILMRTDFPVGALGLGDNGYYAAPFLFNDGSGFEHKTQSVTIQVSVDNEFAKEDRRLNDVEVMFSNRRLDGYTVTDIPLSGLPYDDMIPRSPEHSGGTGDGTGGRIIRFRDLNIPMRQGARVRLYIVVPWFRHTGPTLSAVMDQQGLSASTIRNKFAGWGTNPRGSEPMWNWAMDGNMTVLEQVTR